MIHSDRIFTDCPNHFSDFNLEGLKFFTKNTFIMKNLTDLHKTVETGMDLHLRKLMLVTLKTLKIGPSSGGVNSLLLITHLQL